MKNKGFTLAELLIVVAIIAVLVAISIPIFTNRLEVSREATDLANVRNAYSTLMVDAISDNTSSQYYVGEGIYRGKVLLSQTATNWQTSKPITIGPVTWNGSDTDYWQGTPGKGGSCIVECDRNKETAECVKFIWSGDATPVIDYNSTESVGKYVFKYVSGMLNSYKNGEQTEFDNVFKPTGNIYSTSYTLPNGQEISVKVFNRDYDAYQDIKTRLTANTASFIYNKTTGELSTVIYCDENLKYSSWTVSDGDYSDWEMSIWKDNAY